MRRIANLVDLEKCCKMNIWLQKSALIQKRTSLRKFDHLAEKSEKDSIANLSTKLDGVLEGEGLHMDRSPLSGPVHPREDLFSQTYLLNFSISSGATWISKNANV